MRPSGATGRTPAAPSPPGRGRRGRAAGLWIFGTHAVRAAVANPQRRCRRLLAVADAAHALGEHAHRPGRGAPAVEIVDRPTLEQVIGREAAHQGVAVLVDPLPATPLDAALAAGQPRPFVVLDQVTDPRNVGAVLRAGAAFGAAGVIVQDRHAPPETGTLAKAASGALESVPLVRVVNVARALRALRVAGYGTIGLMGDAPDRLAEIDLQAPVALVLGSEGSGLRRLVRDSCDVHARIPISDRIESLNVATAAAIALYACNAHRS